MTVPFESLELLPQSPPPQTLPLPLKQIKNLQVIKEMSSLTHDALVEEGKCNIYKWQSLYLSRYKLVNSL